MSDIADIIRKVDHLQRLELKPGDRFVLTCGRDVLPDDEAARLKEFLGGAPLLILSEGFSLGVVSSAEQA
ncbi:hypothetical protein [Mesorhizobium amorphae]|uniref:hypothetical protein n=1 Tax=Mesorhizobium amorphae TaxID=71433 RepID=UPI0011846A9D|nr:hypothetical protein [Mesorhizobium amorphae]